ncbi:hypothetical protein PgNI_11441 [Pyricularia grisea]|uniref:Uncharacterized protein n=1 Tax=Pyricularia grisea TaxID=148305 RepID=A0A6P8APQ6_PYRGI|nr:hypothetical protein PgNI_11441 [Pyricularia grisea]TLD04029.1 hypothetical protein PgNI_11441 [Pyricularia grisea]
MSARATLKDLKTKMCLGDIAKLQLLHILVTLDGRALLNSIHAHLLIIVSIQERLFRGNQTQRDGIRWYNAIV